MFDDQGQNLDINKIYYKYDGKLINSPITDLVQIQNTNNNLLNTFKFQPITSDNLATSLDFDLNMNLLRDKSANIGLKNPIILDKLNQKYFCIYTPHN